MKRVFIVILFTIVASLGYAQNPDLAVEGSVVEMTTDLDARAYFPKRDINDRLCALIKVTLTNTLRNPLTLEVGGLGVVAREEKENGEIWFYVPAQVRNLSFKCAGYIAPAPIPVVFKEGTVYGITLSPGAVVETVTNAVLSTNYLKLRVDVTNVTISLGRTKEYELLTQSIEENEFAERLDYGTYYYAIRHPLYETYEGRVELNGSTPKQEVSLKPAFGYLDITSTPEGATIYMDGQKLGTTPYSIEEPMPKGKVNVRAELAEYYSSPMDVNIVGDGSRQNVNITLKPRFADVTMVCPDGEAEIWIDNQLMGVGSWSGHLRSTSRHLVETRRAGHRSQSTQISVKDGERVTHTLNAPVPLYGSVDVNTSPLGCTIKIDGKVVGESPYIGKLLVGDYEVTLSKDGYQQIVFPISVKYNENLSVNKELVVDDSFSTERDLIKELINNQIDEQFESQNNGVVEEIEVEEEIVEEPVFVKVEQMPSFMGGDLNTFRTWFLGEFKIPAEMAEKGIHGRIVVRFVVEKDGSIGGIEFLQSPHKVYEDEVRRVLMESPRWTTGKQRDQLVRVFYILPINCRLQ